MASFFFAPDPLQSTFLVPGGNTPGTGAQLFIYVAGSVSTKTTVYKDNAGNTFWSNPIVLDSGGNLPSGGVIWIPSGVSIKAVWAPSNDTDPPASPYRTIDNIAGINDVTGSQTDWTVGPTPTFISVTQFTLVGDQTAIFSKGRRLKFTVTAGTVYGVITTSTFGVLTTVNVAFDSGSLDSGLSAVSYSVIAPANSSIGPDYTSKYATTVPSAGGGTTNIWGIAGDYTHVTGTNSIAHFSTAPYPGARREIVFDGVLTLTHTSSGLGVSVPGAVNLTTAANDRAVVRADTTSFSVITQYTRASGVPVGGVQTSNTVFSGPVSGAAAVPTFRLLTGADGASRVFLSKKALTGASIQFTSADLDWTAYDFYEYIIYQAVPATNGAVISVTASEDAGSSYLAGTNYNRAFLALDAGGTSRNVSGQNEALWQFPEVAVEGISNTAANNGFNGTLTLWKPSVALRHQASLTGGAYFPGATANMATISGAMVVIGTPAALSGIKFAPSTGNWTSGTIAVYGFRTA